MKNCNECGAERKEDEGMECQGCGLWICQGCERRHEDRCQEEYEVELEAWKAEMDDAYSRFPD